MRRRLLLHEAPEIQRVRESAIDIAGIVRGHAFERIGLVPRNEGRDLAVLDAADANALLEWRIDLLARRRIGGIENVVLVDVDPARPAELTPLGEELAVLIEDLDARIRTVGDEEPSLRIHRQPMRRVELARSRALLAPGLDELAVLGEFDDARVGVAAMAVGDEDVAVRRDQHIRWRVEMLL